MLKNRVSLWKPSAPIPERVGVTEGPLLSSPGVTPAPPLGGRRGRLCTSEDGGVVRTSPLPWEDQHRHTCGSWGPLGFEGDVSPFWRKRCVGRRCCFCCCILMLRPLCLTGGPGVSCLYLFDAYDSFLNIIRNLEGWREQKEIRSPVPSFDLLSVKCFILLNRLEGVRR